MSHAEVMRTEPAQIRCGRSKRVSNTLAAPRFSPTNRLSETRFFRDPCALSRLFLILVLDQRLIDQISEALEKAVLVVGKVLGKDEHDELFNRINEA
jgi:hypothetical protein